MRIPLDYYRILGVPTQATIEQLAQAYQDRSKQLPRKEYSSQAITARGQLLDEAYQVLSNSLSKADYDKQFLSLVPHNLSVVENIDLYPSPYLEIQSEQLSGALVILQELAEYEQVIRLGESYLKNNSHSITPQTDIFLSIALAELELSREQWQQKNYEQASLGGQKGLKLLKNHQVLPTIQLEIETELAKLVPYRILSIFSKSNLQPEERLQGTELLQQLLKVRQGIEGKGNDYSGLNLENFLHFIQQLRPLLSSQEQKTLFSAEAKRPSSVGLYLFVYTLIAQGFAQKEPYLINEAQQKLVIIAQRQDVTIEQSICALLLGQIESSLQQIKNCQDQQILQLMQEHSQNTEDLLPGLCWYAEYWLKFEVLAHFKDFLNINVSLNDYFKDQTVQKAIEQLTDTPLVKTFSKQKITTENTMLTQRRLNDSPEFQPRVNRSTTSNRPSTQENNNRGQNSKTPQNPQSREYRPSEIATRTPTKRRRRRKRILIKPGRLLAVLGVIGIGIGSLVFAWSNLQQIFYNNRAISGLDGEQLLLKIAEPLIKPLQVNTQTEQNENLLTLETAKIVLEDWLKTKAEALGQKHQIDSLNRILTQPVLEIWQKRATELKEQGDYWTFEHQVQVNSLKTVSQVEAQVRAFVKEKANYYQNNKINQNKSYQDNLLFQYDLKKQGERWLISNIGVVK